jgi:signal transduction histidine kinase
LVQSEHSRRTFSTRHLGSNYAEQASLSTEAFGRNISVDNHFNDAAFRLFRKVTDAFSDLAEDQGKTLVAEIEPSLSTWGDRELLSEMVANLLDNALRHTPKVLVSM